MKIVLKQLGFSHFKGAPVGFSENFQPTINNITAPNKSGKTRRVDAFMWILFNKDSQGNTAFEIKPLDASNKVINRVDVEGLAIFEIDGIRNELRKSYREKWVKPRGQATEELQGHETLYFWNDVPLKKGEYDSKVASLINEDLFKLITSPLYFNTLHWEKRRTMLTEMVGTVSSANVLYEISTPENQHRMNALLDVLSSGKKTTEYKKELANKKKRIKDELDTLPSRIDEANLSKPLKPVVIAEVETELATIRQQIADIDTALQSGNSAQQEYRKRRNEAATALDNAMLQVRKINMAIQQDFHAKTAGQGNEVAALTAKLGRAKSEQDLVGSDIKSNTERIARLQNSLAITRQNWKDVNAETFDRDSVSVNSTCPTCKQSLPNDDVEAQISNMAMQFTLNKQQRLETFNGQGKRDKSQIETLESQQAELQDRFTLLQETITDLQAEIKAEQAKPVTRITIEQLQEESAELQAAIKAQEAAKANVDSIEAEVIDNSATIAYQEQKTALKLVENNLVGKIATAGEGERIDARIEELEKQIRTMSQELADLEAAEFAVLLFEKAYMNTVEGRVNEMFTNVKFKMFEQQINGGETPACITLIDGVPWPDVNTAGKINGGLDIINTLCRHYNVYAPIWIDNAESVTNIIDTESQTIRLYVPPQEPKSEVINNKISMPSAKQVAMFAD